MRKTESSKPVTGAELKKEIRRVDGSLKRLDEKVDASTKRLGLQIVHNMAEIEGMREEMRSRLELTRSDILGAINKVMEWGKMYADKAVTHGEQLQEHEAKLQDHGHRIEAVEARST